jgi:hypothetical protein
MPRFFGQQHGEQVRRLNKHTVMHFPRVVKMQTNVGKETAMTNIGATVVLPPQFRLFSQLFPNTHA